MKIRFYSIIALVMMAVFSVYGGNPDRQGQAGASELLMNPWGHSAGLHSMNTSSTMGVEAMRINIAGLSRINSMEIAISNNRLYSGSDMNLNAGGIGIKLGKGALGIEFASLNFGDIPVTTPNQPAGTGGYFSPSFTQLGVGYSLTYANRISVGALVRVVSESIQDINATGIALDAGVQYVAGDNDNFKLGIALRNVGTPMAFGGEGLTVRRPNPTPDGGVSYELAYDSRGASFELPSTLNIGVSYDFYVGDEDYIRALGNFTSNAFSKDQIGVGAEFSFRNIFAVRAAYKVDLGESTVETQGLYTGLAAGASVEVPISRGGGNNLGLDYAYRATNPYRGTHNFTLRFSF
ncbi:MAG: PorV/PorQ family protein [Saprospiraceae bacterium]|nr:MAG: hypothetical protein UZ09_BCD002001910 [Bacteroidetes bacterium OLB9]MCO6464839.1 PorV/PorQ family protein [Saprospiraceae bacterium]